MPKISNAAAFDFDKLEQHYMPQPLPKVKQPPELRVVSTRGERNAGFLLRSAAVFVVALAIVAAILYNNVALTELTAQIEDAQLSLEQLKSENRRMQVELEGRISLRSVEEQAEKVLGMAKAEPYQIEYIDLGEGDCVLLAREVIPSLTERVRQVCASVLEYIGQ